VLLLGSFAIFAGNADFSRVVMFEGSEDKSFFLAVTTATSLAFFAMVGFEDSVNMAEETKDPSRTFPKMLLTGLSLAAVIYVLVSIVAVAVVPVGRLAESDTPLTTFVETAVPDFPITVVLPFISMFAVANSALINMLMASRLLYGMSRQGVLPPFLCKVLRRRRTPYAAVIFTTAIAVGLIAVLSLAGDDSLIALLGGTTSLLLLTVFAVVNVAVLVLRRDPVDHDHFRTPGFLPVVGVLACVALVLPWTSGRDIQQYVIAGALIAIGLVLWVVTVIANRRVRDGAGRGDLTEIG
jgi:APA family basic amino acid/polyamine antiporter